MGGGKEFPHYVSVEQCDAREEEALFELTGWTIREENHFLKMTDIFIQKMKDGPEEDIQKQSPWNVSPLSPRHIQ